ncbi:hypothetical protein GQ457_02G025310 [Hibiscus cannabinus]
MHKILLEDNHKPTVDAQRRLNQAMKDVVRKEILKWLDAGYNQIAIAPEDQSKTTFTCPYGTFAFRRMPFGLCNVPATFQRCMTAIFSDLNEDCLEIFMDDFSTFGDNFDNCLSNLEKVLKRCKETNLVLNWEKCHFMVDEGIVLGHKISSKGMEVDKAKIEVISKLPPPSTVKGIRSFLGHAGFYRRFIEDFLKITKPLCSLLEQGRQFKFNEECTKAFNLQKQKLVTAPIVEPPDWKLPFELMCDASDYAGRKRFKYNAEGYFWDEPYLFKQCADQIIRRCIPEEEQQLILEQCHSAPYGGHFGGNRTAAKVLQSGLYWPTLHRDAQLFCQQCDRCQRTRNISRRNEMPLQNILEVELFDVWGIDFMGPFPSSFGNLYILLAVDYVSKWVEAIATTHNDAKTVQRFIKKNIFTRFGTPRVIISDDQIIRRCIPEEEQQLILEQCHSAPYGGHFGGNRKAAKVLQSGLYWPTLHRDAQLFCQQCDRCQRTRNISRRNEMPLQNILEVELFDVWGIDFMGPFPSSFGNLYILLAVDYVSKWVEAIATTHNDAKTVQRFIKKNIFTRFGTPRVIISDEGRHFDNRSIAPLRKLGINHKLSTASHPQTNGQAEIFNREIKSILEKVKRLLEINELEEIRNTAYENAKIYKEKTKKWHDQKFLPKEYQLGQQVLLFNSRLKLFTGKLKSRWSGPFIITHVSPHGAITIKSPKDDNEFKVNGQRLKLYMGAHVERDRATMSLRDA